MPKKTTVAIAHSDEDLGKPGECTREQLDLVKGMIRAKLRTGRWAEWRTS